MLQTHEGRNPSVPTSLVVWSLPCSSTWRSSTSMVLTFGFRSLGYFLQTACVTRSQQWLKCGKKNKVLQLQCCGLWRLYNGENRLAMTVHVATNTSFVWPQVHSILFRSRSNSLLIIPVLLVFSVTPFKKDQNQNQNCSIDKVRNLGNERR